MVQVIVTDIEGTTTSLSYVHDVLFPYARRHLADYIAQHRHEPAVQDILTEVGTLVGRPLCDNEAVDTLLGWMDEDRKITPLKTLQGMIWRDGYQRGELNGQVYPDAVEKLTEWHRQGIRLAVFSSGSVEAQQLLFRHTAFGDLTPLFSAYFDTRIGAKKEPQAYEHICRQMAVHPRDSLFLSDVTAELDAAREAGLHTCWLVRGQNPPPPGQHPQARDFHEIRLP